jgi:Flp pilus assembly protein TadG
MRTRRERGAVNLEIAVLMPAVLALVLVAIQAAAVYHAHNLALSAAREGVRVARGYGSTTGAGVDSAEDYLRTVAGDALRDTSVSSRGSTASRVRMEVTGKSMAVIPGFSVTVTEVARGPREVVTRP